MNFWFFNPTEEKSTIKMKKKNSRKNIGYFKPDACISQKSENWFITTIYTTEIMLLFKYTSEITSEKLQINQQD